MADLRRFMWEGTHSGMAIDLYFGRVFKVGEGKVETLEELKVKLSAKGRIVGIPFEGNVEITMPDTSPQGVCSVALNNGAPVDCPYRTEGNILAIDHPETQLKVNAKDKKWTWINVNKPISGSVGIWPKGQ